MRGGLSQPQLSQALDYIQSNLNQPISLAELAGVVKLSPYHFARLFKQSTGLPPHQYQLKCRVDRAKELLQLGGFAIADTAQTVGFSSQGHLNYHFKRLVGLTPKAPLSILLTRLFLSPIWMRLRRSQAHADKTFFQSLPFWPARSFKFRVSGSLNS